MVKPVRRRNGKPIKMSLINFMARSEAICMKQVQRASDPVRERGGEREREFLVIGETNNNERERERERERAEPGYFGHCQQ